MKNNLLNKVSNIYIFLIIVIFPILVDKTGYYHILEFKWNVFVIISVLYLFSILFLLLYYYFFKKINYLKKVKIGKVHIFCIITIFLFLLSTILSPYFDVNNFLLGGKRREGIIVTFLYFFTFFTSSLFLKFNKKQILYFIISSILVSTICILQFFGFNPFNLYRNGIGTHNVSFMGTIGNIDFLSAFYVLTLTITISYFIFNKNNKLDFILCIISIVFGFFIFGIINVLSGKVAFILMLTIILPYIIKNNKRFSKFMIVIASFLFAYLLNYILNVEYHQSIQKLGIYFRYNFIALGYTIIIFLLLLVSFLVYKNKYNITNNKIIKLYYLLLFIMGIIFIIGVYFIDFKSGILYEIHSILHFKFNDEFGTYRMFLWKRTLKMSSDYFWLGTGSDSFRLRFMSLYTKDVLSIGKYAINDTAGNVYLTMLINYGIIGLFSYLSMIYNIIKSSIKSSNIYTKILLCSFIAFLIQDCFNLWLVIVTPLLFCLMSIILSSIVIEK